MAGNATSVERIVEEYLKLHRYDGLLHPRGECGCKMKDLMPCGIPHPECQPGYEGPDPTGEADFIVYPSTVDVKMAKMEVAKQKRQKEKA